MILHLALFFSDRVSTVDATRSILSDVSTYSITNENGDYISCGPPEAIRPLIIGDSASINSDNSNNDRNHIVIKTQRPYLNPVFQDLSKPYQHT